MSEQIKKLIAEREERMAQERHRDSTVGGEAS